MSSKPQLLGSTPRPGDIKYEDVNGDGQIDTNDNMRIDNLPWLLKFTTISIWE